MNIEHRAGKENAVNDAPSRNMQECFHAIKTVKGRCSDQGSNEIKRRRMILNLVAHIIIRRIGIGLVV